MDIIKPMLAKQADLPENEAEYGFEIKWDGMRTILYCQDGQLKMFGRNQNELTQRYPELHCIAAAKRELILDGEIVCFDDTGKPSFFGLQHRIGLSDVKNITERMKKYPVTYIIFDLLALNGDSTQHLPYIQRREILDRLNLNGPSWQTPAYQIGSGQAMMKAIHELGLEGMVAKQLTSAYHPGQRTGEWLKIKDQRRQEFIIAGWIPGNGIRSGLIGALLLGYYDNRQLHFAGKVGTGFTMAGLKQLKSCLASLVIEQNPFNSAIPYKAAIFVQPVLVCEIEFTEWTPQNTLRHPSFKGLRTDKPANEVIRES